MALACYIVRNMRAHMVLPCRVPVVPKSCSFMSHATPTTCVEQAWNQQLFHLPDDFMIVCRGKKGTSRRRIEPSFTPGKAPLLYSSVLYYYTV